MVKRRVPNVVRGGIAIPLKDKTNYYYMAGRKHKNGGIDIGENPRTGLEVEDGEVMHVSKDEIKVFSSVPFLNGKSPAQKVLGGENPNTVFKQQEQFKDRNNINDDGTKKKAMGGKTPKRKYTTTLTIDEEKQFKDWYSKVAKHKKLNPNPDADGQDYDYRGYWKNEDRDGILSSNSNAHFPDKYKQPTHPTFSNGSIYSNDKTPGGTWVRGKGTWLFKHNKFTARQADRTADYLNGTGEGFILGTDTIIQNIKKRMGGLSRSKDYGSKSKPYPSIKSGDFAGGHRSYPIPTKSDAIDALRLAGLHGRSDVRAKVYAKYPDLRKKSKSGGLYSVTVNGETKLKMFPSTGNKTKAPFGTDIKLEEPKDILGVYRPFNSNGSVNLFYSPAMDGKRRLKEYHRNTNFNDDGTFNLQSYLDRQRENNDPFKLNTVSTNDSSDNNDWTYTPILEYKRLYDKFNVKGLNRKFDKDYFNLINALKADENLTVADIYNGGENTEDAKIREILGANSTYKDIFNTDKENKLYDYYTTTYPEMNVVESGSKNNKTATNNTLKEVVITPKNDEYETNMSITNNKPFESTTLKEVVVTPEDVKDNTENRIAKNEKRNRLINSYLNGYHGDAINLLSNIGGNIATALINRRALNKMQAPPQPMSQTAAKLKTRININPQLDKMRETLAAYERDVDNNTASSRVALARKQRARFANMLQTNELYSTKENAETELINKDRLNQQEVANNNVKAYNAWQDKVNAFNNAITEKKAENLVGLTQGITSGITSTIGNVQQRMRDDKSILANALSHPNLPIEEFYHNGLISKRAYKAYRKAHPLKTNTNEEEG